MTGARGQEAGGRGQGATARNVVVVLVLAAAFAAASWMVEWWIVPLLAAALSLGMGRVATPTRIAVGAGLGWAGLLALGAVRGPVAKLAAMLGALLHTPALVLVLLTVLFPAVLAWSAAAVVARGEEKVTTAELTAPAAE